MCSFTSLTKTLFLMVLPSKFLGILSFLFSSCSENILADGHDDQEPAREAAKTDSQRKIGFPSFFNHFLKEKPMRKAMKPNVKCHMSNVRPPSSPVSWSRARPRRIAAVDRIDSWLASWFGVLCDGSAICTWKRKKKVLFSPSYLPSQARERLVMVSSATAYGIHISETLALQ